MKKKKQSTATVVERAHFTRTVWKEKQQATHNEIPNTSRKTSENVDLAIFLFTLLFQSVFICHSNVPAHTHTHTVWEANVHWRMVFLFLHLQWQLFNITFLGGIWTISMPVALIAVFIVILLAVKACILRSTHTHTPHSSYLSYKETRKWKFIYSIVDLTGFK